MVALALLLPAIAFAQAPTAAPQSTGSLAGNVDQTSSSSVAEQTTQDSASKSGTPPLVGAKEFGLGSTGEATSYLIPSIQYTAFVNTNPGFSASGAKPLLQNTYAGSLTLQRVTPNTQFNLNYAGGAQFYNQPVSPEATNSGSSYGTFHQASIGESVNWRRWELYVGDEGSYLPESPEGFTGFDGLTSFNAGLGGDSLWSGGNLSSFLQPDQSILTTFARRVSNTSSGQLQYNATPRTALSVTGAYGMLNFLDPGFTNDQTYSLLASVTHALSPRSYIGVTYLYSLIHFDAPYQNILDQGPVISYGRRIVGRLSIDLSAGVLQNQFANPNGSSTSQAFVTTFDSLHYRWRGTDLSASFNRSVTGGSGILLGAETDLIEGDVGRQLFRTMRLDLNFGRYDDQALVPGAPGTPRAASKAWEGGINLSRDLGRHLSIFLQYNVEDQIANAGLCAANRCGATFVQQIGGIGLNWHTRPLRLQ